jgi:hypothetical protein
LTQSSGTAFRDRLILLLRCPPADSRLRKALFRTRTGDPLLTMELRGVKDVHERSPAATFSLHFGGTRRTPVNGRGRALRAEVCAKCAQVSTLGLAQ